MKKVCLFLAFILMLNVKLASCNSDNSANMSKLVVVVDKFSFRAEYENAVNLFNQKLKEMNKEYYIELNVIDNLTQNDEITSYSKKYQDAVIKMYSEKKQADMLVMANIDDSSGFSDYDAFYKNGLLVNLDNYIDDKVYNVADEKVWKSSERNGHKYIVPTSGDMTVRCWSVENSTLLKYNLNADDLQGEIWDIAENEKLNNLNIYADTASQSRYSGSGNSVMPYNAENYYDIVTACVGVRYDSEKSQAINIFNDEYMTKSIEYYYQSTDIDNADVCIYQDILVNTNVIKTADTTYVPVDNKGYLQGNVNGLGIASWSENHDYAYDLIYELNTNKELALLLNYGIEGENYTKNTDGSVTVSDSQFKDYYNPFYIFSNRKVLPEDAQISLTTDYSKAEISPICGFIFDDSKVKTEIKSVNSVITEYSETLLSAYGDYDVLFPEFNSKLKEAGVDKIVAEVNRQIEKWQTNQSN